MRRVLVVAVLPFFAGCNSSNVRPQDLASARAAQTQSVSAYQICTEQNMQDPKKCDALAKLSQADDRRLSKLTTPK